MATQAQEAQSAVGSNNSRTGIIQDEEDPKPKPTEYELTYPTNHLFVLSPTNPFRRLCVKIGTSKGLPVLVDIILYGFLSRAFDMFILIAIVVNCIMMAMNAPLPGEDKSQMNNSLDVFSGRIREKCIDKVVKNFESFLPGSYEIDLTSNANQ